MLRRFQVSALVGRSSLHSSYSYLVYLEQGLALTSDWHVVKLFYLGADN